MPSPALLEAAVELIDILWTSAEPQLALPANEGCLAGLYQVISNSGIQSIYEWMSSKVYYHKGMGRERREKESIKRERAHYYYQGKTTLLRVASHLPADKTVSLYEDVVLPAFSALGEQEEDEGEEEKGAIDGNLCYALLSCLYKWDHAEEVGSHLIFCSPFIPCLSLFSSLDIFLIFFNRY